MVICRENLQKINNLLLFSTVLSDEAGNNSKLATAVACSVGLCNWPCTSLVSSHEFSANVSKRDHDLIFLKCRLINCTQWVCLYFCLTLTDLQIFFTARFALVADNLQQNSIKIPTWFKLTNRQTTDASA